jgi:hypothetical protein
VPWGAARMCEMMLDSSIITIEEVLFGLWPYELWGGEAVFLKR